MYRFLVSAFAALMLLSACNTVQGAGEDISGAGHAVSDAAADTKDNM